MFSYGSKFLAKISITSKLKNIKQYINIHEQQHLKFPQNLKVVNGKQLSQFIKLNNINQSLRIIHALANIQFNAFNAYYDTYYRFQLIKDKQFYEDIRKITIDEGQHFLLLNNRLKQLGSQFGNIPVITQLHKIIELTQSDLLGRIGLISLLHEGKGLKAIKKLISILQREKDQKSISILKQIQKEEVFHYHIGRKWFQRICQNQNINMEKGIELINNQYGVKIQMHN